MSAGDRVTIAVGYYGGRDGRIAEIGSDGTLRIVLDGGTEVFYYAEDVRDHVVVRI